MNQSSPIAEVPDSDHVDWKDIEEIANKLFSVWMSGEDLAWAKIAWQALSQAGMTAYTSEEERTICLVRLIALSALYREFCVRAFDEGESDEWQEALTNDLVGGYPLLDAFTLGQLAERRQIHVDNSPEYDSYPSSLDHVVLELVSYEYPSVVDALRAQWGENAFFTSLYISAKPGEDEDLEDGGLSPVTDDQIDRVMNQDVTSGTERAFSWFSGGLPL